jgi:hypothetical protein
MVAISMSVGNLKWNVYTNNSQLLEALQIKIQIVFKVTEGDAQYVPQCVMFSM